MKINQNVILKALTFLLCFYIAIMPIFQYKTVKASAFDKARSFTYIVVDILVGLKTVGFISDTTLTPENLENIYNKADDYLHENFGTELEYAEALRQVDQLGLDIASGQIFVPGNYSGKLWYSFLNAVVDVVWSTQKEHSIDYVYKTYYLGSYQQYQLFFCPSSASGIWKTYPFTSIPKIKFKERSEDLFDYIYNLENVNYFEYARECGTFYVYNVLTDKYLKSNNIEYEGLQVYTSVFSKKYTISVDWEYDIINIILGGKSGNVQKVQDINKKTTNKVKLPTRLPQTVINNINNYIDNSTENLIIAPTADELPQLPEDYNPNTDDPPDLPGYEDVTPDQPGTTDPEPTPTPTPEPTPTPPEYDGSSWIKPIGDFFAGLLSFLKDALIPTQTVDVTPLQNMGADVSGKFPFSLPGDIGKLFGVLNAEPIRPHFEMDFDLSKVGIPGEPIHWDLNVEQWDNGAAVVKTALYIAFLIGLVFITKQFMQN